MVVERGGREDPSLALLKRVGGKRREGGRGGDSGSRAPREKPAILLACIRLNPRSVVCAHVGAPRRPPAARGGDGVDAGPGGGQGRAGRWGRVPHGEREREGTRSSIVSIATSIGWRTHARGLWGRRSTGGSFHLFRVHRPMTLSCVRDRFIGPLGRAAAAADARRGGERERSTHMHIRKAQPRPSHLSIPEHTFPPHERDKRNGTNPNYYR